MNIYDISGMAENPDNLSPEERKRIESRRGFFKRGAVAAVPVVTGVTQAAAAPIVPVDEGKHKLLEGLSTLIDQASVDFTIYGGYEPQSYAPLFVGDRSADHLSHQHNRALAAKEALTALNAQMQAVKSSLGSEVFFPKADLFKDCVDDKGVLQVAKLEQATNNVVSRTTSALARHNDNYAKAEQVIRHNASTVNKVVEHVGKKYPHIPKRRLAERLQSMNLRAPEGSNWSDHFSNPSHIDAAIGKENHGHLSRLSEFYSEKMRLRKLSYEDRRAEYGQKTVDRLKQFFEHPIFKGNDKHFYMEIPAPSPKLYEALRNIVTLRDPQAAFPAYEEIFVAKLEDSDGNVSWAPIDVRVPPAGYAIHLSNKWANRFCDILDGKAELATHENSVVFEGDAAEYYRKRSEVGMMLAHDLQTFNTLIKGKWAQQIQPTAKDSSPRIP